MSAEQCPLCFSLLETREVGPCMDCGHKPQELHHFAERRHDYAEYRIFGALSLVLCDFCRVDFGSSDPTFFGLPAGARRGFEHLSFVRTVAPPPHTFDKVCLECYRRLCFLQFAAAARELHGS